MYKLIKADPATWAFEGVMPDGDTVRFFVLDGNEKCLVIDSGFLDIDVKGMVKDMLREEGKLLKPDGSEKEILLANTHADMDHTGGNRSFDRFYITETDYKNGGLKEQCPDSVLIAAEEGTQIDLGGRKLKYMMAPGHTWGNAVLLDETSRTLFPGDMVQSGTMFMFGPHRCPEKLEESLLKLIGKKDEFDRIYACHGQMVLEPDAADDTLKAWKMVQNKEITPVSKEVLGTEVDLYCCGFCNFFCNAGQYR